jgi:hypothetical protein
MLCQDVTKHLTHLTFFGHFQTVSDLLKSQCNSHTRQNNEYIVEINYEKMNGINKLKTLIFSYKL